MGTNYYFKIPYGEDRHIGKSSAGWTFALHVYPEEEINDLPDWLRYFDSQEGKIFDEYGREITVPEMLSIIRDRKWGEAPDYWEKTPMGYQSWGHFHHMNHSLQGPNGLVRRKVESHESMRQSFINGCIKHGEGTWDCLVGEFS